MDESTTDVVAQDQAQVITAQLEEQPAEAETTPTSEPTPTQPQTDAPMDEPVSTDNPTEGEEFNSVEFWSKKGIDITTPEGQAKAAKSYSEAEKRMHQSTQRSSELEKQVKAAPSEQYSSDPTAQKAMEMATAAQQALEITNWKQANQITPEQDEKMGQYLVENQDKAYLLRNGYLSLDDIRAMSGVDTVDSTAIKQQGGKEALEQLANKQRTTAPRGAAVQTTQPKSDPIMDALLSDD
ncbi:hypothetical protein GS464_29600 [Rhodococcus hoagii]|nr:hypothetical protein [Prescottella equi]MBM4644786.1 hypothetical protein [Prescottella equi]MBM4646573.1 hypothetical protein [Prescottella equi]